VKAASEEKPVPESATDGAMEMPVPDVSVTEMVKLESLAPVLMGLNSTV
jgi:hypothetical protein